MWSEGKFNRVSSIQIKLREFLQSLNLKEQFKEEHQVKYYSIDFAFPLAKVAIECQGTYFHIDPRVYPNGPETKMQRQNKGRDKAKHKLLCENWGWRLMEVWEIEINNDEFKEQVKCKLKELGLLND